jgi:tetratricopeptide (TPR) repeat protein
VKTLVAKFFVVLLLALTVSFASAQDSYDTDRQRALQLVQENNLIGALPLLEKLAAVKPEDTGVLQNLALALAAQAIAGKNPDQMKANFRRARELAEKCRKLGDNSQLVQTILERLPTEDQMNVPPKASTPADEALQAGEAAFSSGDFKRALAEYEKAEKLDPKLYEAPLFAGDVHFKLNDIEKAGAAYSRAIIIDPNRDTAYRFWGNALLQSGKMEESKQKLIEAIICEPYSRAPWQYLSNWSERNKTQLGHPRVDVPTSSVQRKDDKNISVTAMLSDKKDGTEAWTMYSLVKAAWMGETFKKEFPKEKEYRHSLREESEALKAAIESLQVQLKEGGLKESALDVSIANLLKLHRAGLIEPFILLAKPDEGIARDYTEYRKNNRDKLRRYLAEFVIASK